MSCTRNPGSVGTAAKPVDRGLRFLQVGVCTARKQGFHQSAVVGPRNTELSPVANTSSMAARRQFDRPVEIAASGLLLGEYDVDERQRWPCEALLHGSFAGL